MIYPETYRARGILSRFHRSSHPLIARLAGGIIPVLLLLAGGVIPHNALGQTLVAAGQNTLMDAVEDAAAGDIIELIDSGGEYLNDDQININVPLTIRAAAGLDEKPVIKNNEADESTRVVFRIYDDFTLQGVEIDGQADNPDFNAKYLLRIDDNDDGSGRQADGLNLKVYDSYLHDVIAGSDGNFLRQYPLTLADSIIFRNVVMDNSGKEGIRSKDESTANKDMGIHNVKYFEVSNSTISNTKADAIYVDGGDEDENTPEPEFIVDGLTCYNCGSDNGRAIFPRNILNATITNTIIAHGPTGTDGAVLIEGNSSITYSNLFEVSRIKLSSGATESNNLMVNPMFADPENLDFTLGNAVLLTAGSTGGPIGDPRWAMPVPPPPLSQTRILRVDGGPVTVDLDAAFEESSDPDWTVHHYQVDGGSVVNDPGASFVVGSQAWVQLDEDTLTINPTGPGGFKIAVQPGTDDPQPLRFEVMSANAPMVQGVSSGAGYNEQVNDYVEAVTLTVVKETSKKVELFDLFSDSDDIILSYNYHSDDLDLRPVVTNPDVVTATLDGSKLTVALTDQAKGGDTSDIWIYAVDPAGEYARLPISVNVSSRTGPYVVNALDDVFIREDDATDTKVYLHGAFEDGSGDALAYEVTVNDDSKVEIGENPTVVITPIMRTEIDLRNVGPNSTGDITIRPRATGSVTFTVKASATGESVADAFTLTIVSRNAPKIKTQIPDQELAADGGPMTIDLTDVDPKKEGAQPAFEDPAGGGLTYTTSLKNTSVVRAGAMEASVTLTPIWGTGGHTYVTVSATNGDGETFPQTFKVTVKGATLPIVNPQVQPILDTGIMLNPGDDPLVLDLKALPSPLNPEESLGALFLDPNANPDDTLPGGLLYRMRVEDVDAPHRYDALSTENDVVTSAMRITLDPLTTILTITPTAPNYANITIGGIDREHNEIFATMMVTVTNAVSAEDEELPAEVSLAQNYPNPFNPQTTIDYSLPKASDVSLVVYDMLGREVEVLLEGSRPAGQYSMRFGADHLPNGTYVYRLVAGDKTITRTMVLLK